MARDIKADLLKHLDDVISEYEDIYTNVKDKWQFTDLRRDPAKLQHFLASAMAVVERVAGRNTDYYKRASAVISEKVMETEKVPQLSGIVKALREAIDKDYLRTMTELIHGDIFGDFLEMADHLVSEGYKDPAAVMAGGVLEEHLRQLCNKSGVSPLQPSGKPKKADLMNADLAGQNVYSKLDQKSITGWLDLRNKAAHGKYTEYGKEQVELLIQSIRDFITRNPA